MINHSGSDKNRKRRHNSILRKLTVRGIRNPAISMILALIMIISIPVFTEGPGPGIKEQKAFIDDHFWAKTSAVKIMKTDQYQTQTPIWDDNDQTIRISLAKNEYESFQMVFRPYIGPLYENITFYPLKNTDDPTQIIGITNLSLYLVDYAGSIYPDPLMPLFSNHIGNYNINDKGPSNMSWDVNLEPSETTAVWVTLYAPKDIPAGTYRTNLTFTQNEGETTRVLEVKVWDFSLPDTPSLDSWFESSSSSYAYYYPFTSDDEEYDELVKRVTQILQTHRINPGKLCGTEPWDDDIIVDYINNTVQIDFTRTDELLEYYIEELNISNFEFPLTAYNPVRWDRNPYDFSSYPFEPPEGYKEVLGDYIQKVADHFREKGWLDRCILYYCDEPVAYTNNYTSPHKHPPYSLHRIINDIIEQNASDMKHLITKSIEPGLYGYGEIWDVPHSHYHLNDAARRQNLGEEVWWYNVGGGIDNDALGHRALYWDSFNSRVDGVEHWSLNYWGYHTNGNNPWFGSYDNGDGYIIYPASWIDIDDDVVLSIRLELTREGMEDYEYLHQYSELFGRASAEAVASAIQPASIFQNNPMTISEDVLVKVRNFLGNSIESSQGGYEYWHNSLNGTIGKESPWSNLDSNDGDDGMGIIEIQNLVKSWSGDGGFLLDMEYDPVGFLNCDDASNWLPSNQPSLNSSISVENTPNGFVEGSGALNFSFWRNDENISELYNSRVQCNSFILTDWQEYDLLQFECKSRGISLNQFYIELGFEGGSWYDRMGRFSNTGTMADHWQHVTIDLSGIDHDQLDYIQFFTHNDKMEIPFKKYSLLLDNITLQNNSRVNSGRITFEAIDLGPIPTGDWHIELLGNHIIHPGCGISVEIRESRDGINWDGWDGVSKVEEKAFIFREEFLPERHIQLRVTITGNPLSSEVSPFLSEVRFCHIGIKYVDIGVGIDDIFIQPEHPIAGEEFSILSKISKHEEHKVKNTNVGISLRSLNNSSIIYENNITIDLKNEVTPVSWEKIILSQGDYIIEISMSLDQQYLDFHLGNNTAILPLHVNEYPEPSITGPDVGKTYQNIAFSGEASKDEGGAITSYSWDMGDGNIHSGKWINHTYMEPGEHWVVLTVLDNEGLSASKDHLIDIIKTRPNVEMEYSPGEGNVTTDYHFQATVYDPHDSIIRYDWDFDADDPDNPIIHNRSVNWSFADDRWYNVSLNISYLFGNSTNEKISLWEFIHVDNMAPKPSPEYLPKFVGNETVNFTVDDIITFTGESTIDPDDELDQLRFHWDFGDNNTSNKLVEWHRFEKAGYYNITFRVTDDDGAQGFAYIKIFIQSRAPYPDFTQTPSTAYTNESVVFNASTSIDQDGFITEYTWVLSGNNLFKNLTFKGIELNHVFDLPGNYTLNLTVLDDTGNIVSISKQIVVQHKDKNDMSTGDGDDKNKDDSLFTWAIIIALIIILITVLFVLFRTYGKRIFNKEKELEEEEDPEEKKRREYEKIYGISPENETENEE